MIRTYNLKEFKRNLKLVFKYNPNIPGESIQRMFFFWFAFYFYTPTNLLQNVQQIKWRNIKGLSKRYELVSPDWVSSSLSSAAPLFLGTYVQLALRKKVLLILRTSVSYWGRVPLGDYKYEIYRTQLIAWEYLETKQSP